MSTVGVTRVEDGDLDRSINGIPKSRLEKHKMSIFDEDYELYLHYFSLNNDCVD